MLCEVLMRTIGYVSTSGDYITAFRFLHEQTQVFNVNKRCIKAKELRLRNDSILVLSQHSVATVTHTCTHTEVVGGGVGWGEARYHIPPEVQMGKRKSIGFCTARESEFPGRRNQAVTSGSHNLASVINFFFFFFF